MRSNALSPAGGGFRQVVIAGGLVAGAAIVVVVVALGLIFPLWYADRIYPGVRTMGIDLGGKDRDEARQLLSERFEQYASSAVPLHYRDVVWQLTPAALGLTFDAEATTNRAFSFGRNGSVFTQIAERIQLVSGGSEVSPLLDVDDNRTASALADLNKEVRQLPVNAGLEFGPDGTVRIVPSKQGEEIDVDAANAAIEQTLLKLATDPILLPVRVLPVSLSESALQEASARAHELVSQPLTLLHGEDEWTLTPQDLTELIAVQEANGAVSVQWNESNLTDRLLTIKREIDSASIDAKIELDGTEIRLTREQAGAELDLAATIAKIRENVGPSQRHVDLVVQRREPTVREEHLAPVREKLEMMLSAPVVVAADGQEWALDVDEIAQIIKIEPMSAPPFATIAFDRAGLMEIVEERSARFSRPARDARFRILDGNLQLVQPEQTGRTVDVARTADAIQRAIESSSREVTPVFQVTAPKVTAAMAGQIVIREKIMDASTSYAGSIPERAHNIELAAERLNGTLVPPGGTFSFNESLGPASLQNGFKLGWGIALNANGGAQTVPSEAGGICQVSTTLFHAVFWAGYEIVERNWHLYWIPRYGQPPRGLTGLDATVDDVYGVDFRFKNNTDNWLMITTATDGKTLSFALHGTKPDWEVRVGDPVVTNVVKANTEIVRQLDPSFAPGRQLWIEQAHDGFDVAIPRTVVRNGQVIDDWTARAHYLPARNVMLVGPSVPAAPTPTPASTESPTPAPASTESPTPAPASAEESPTPAPQASPTPAPAQ